MKLCFGCYQRYDIRAFTGSDGTVYSKCFSCRVSKANQNRTKKKEDERLAKLDSENDGDLVLDDLDIEVKPWTKESK